MNYTPRCKTLFTGTVHIIVVCHTVLSVTTVYSRCYFDIILHLPSLCATRKVHQSPARPHLNATRSNIQNIILLQRRGCNTKSRTRQ